MRKYQSGILILSLLGLFTFFFFDSIRTQLGLLQPTVPVHKLVGKQDEIHLKLPVAVYPRVQLNDTLRLILKRLHNGEKLSFKQTTDYMLWNQEDAFIQAYFDENDADEESRAYLEHLIEGARKRFFSLVPMGIETMNPAQIKAEMENGLQDSFEGSPLLLSRDKANVLDVLTENLGQDYSLTSLYLLVARQMGRDRFRAQNFTVIYTDGRMLPGYIEKHGDELRLFGLDFHRKGEGGPIYFGRLRDLSNAVEVVDAELFMMTNLYRGRIANACELRNEIRLQSFARWGKPGNAPVERNCARQNDKFLVDILAQRSTLAEDPLNASMQDRIRRPLREVGGSIFAFGKSKVLPGTTARLRATGLRDFSVQYSSLDVAPVAELVDTLNAIQNSN